MDEWVGWFDHAADLLFDWVYINPFHYPGFSGSLYAVKDYRRLNPLFLPRTWPAGEGLAPLDRLVQEAEKRNLHLMMDLVINHTSKDSVLVAGHPEWFVRDEKGAVKSPSAIDPADARKVTVWGDLAEVDNHRSSGRRQLWAYWEELVRRFARIGFSGFRCDAAYQVPAELWRRLIAAAKKENPGCVFFAETLGCRISEVKALEDAGFDCIADSSKWWNFSDEWCLKQHESFRKLGPSIAFPETHDTERLAAETGGREHVQKQRYLFSAFFSSGILMPMGYEYGARKRLNVVDTTPDDREPPLFDLSDFITEVNRLKRDFPILHAEGAVDALWGLDGTVLCLRKKAGDAQLFALINKDWEKQAFVEFSWPEGVSKGAQKFLLAPGREKTALNSRFSGDLAPCEIVLLSVPSS